MEESREETDAQPSSTLASDPSLVDAFADVRVESPAGLPLIHASLAGALFGPNATGGLGRFRVLERLGAGAMGVVYAAYDPDLDRGVALKLVRVSGERERTLAEAKALARLSHPHVVPIFDVGIAHDHVYLVMELVRGETLRAWSRGQSRNELLDAYRQAGEALAAAHAAGLVHRDFKPDNALVGKDGRVRVVDFGLAREAADPEVTVELPRSIAGTPRYMAPEQARGAAASPRADQYSFCVALSEALDGASDGPPPRWLADVLDRGRAAEPAARFPSMPDLLRALARDPARIRRRRIAFAAAVAVAAATFLAGNALSSAAPDSCSGANAELAATWHPAARAGDIARLATFGPYGRSLAPGFLKTFDDHARRWAAGHRAACLAHRRGEQSAVLLDRRMACLERRRASLAAVADIVRAATRLTLPDLALAVSALPDPDACADVDALVRDVDPPSAMIATKLSQIRDAIERARVLIAAGRAADASKLAAQAVAWARLVGYVPVLAEALLVRGQAAIDLSNVEVSVTSLREATDLGFATGLDAVAIEAWARRAWVLGMNNNPAALDGLAVVEALARGDGATAFARALLHNNLGSVELARSRRTEARAAFERALVEAREVVGAGAVELVMIRSNLATTARDPGERAALIEGAEAELIRLLGDGHPRVLATRLTRGLLTVSPIVEALRLLTPTCEQLEQFAGLGVDTARCWAEVSFLRREVGDDAGSIDAASRAASLTPDGPARLELLAYVALWQGYPEQAIAGFAQALAELERDDSLSVRIKRPELLLGLGRAQRVAGRTMAARTSLQAAIDAFVALIGESPTARSARRLARARSELVAIETNVTPH